MSDIHDLSRDGPVEVSEVSSGLVDTARVAGLYESHGEELRRFILGVTRDVDTTNDVLQATFVKAVESGNTARVESFKGWLFRVAFHEALAARRRQETRENGLRRLASRGESSRDLPEDRLIRSEAVEEVRRALRQLPDEQARVVRARIYEEKPFVEIAREFGIPLGTVLTRMRLALEKLRRNLRPGE
ncbi:RNA polymerase sigma factor [Singulisphaera rosea]